MVRTSKRWLLTVLTTPMALLGQPDLILIGAKVLTADATRPATEAVAVAGERIQAIGLGNEIRSLAGPKTRIVDLRGRTVIPGLMDAHVHLLVGSMITDEGSLREYERGALPKQMASFIRHGVTTIRSTADPLPYIAQIRDRLQRDQLTGPRLLITGPTPCSPGGHPATTVCRDNLFCRQGVSRELDGEKQARQLVRELVRANVDAVKVTLEDRFPVNPRCSCFPMRCWLRLLTKRIEADAASSRMLPSRSISSKWALTSLFTCTAQQLKPQRWPQCLFRKISL